MWHRAKLADDWASFEPYVERIVDACRRRAEALDPARDAYDVLLDNMSAVWTPPPTTRSSPR